MQLKRDPTKKPMTRVQKFNELVEAYAKGATIMTRWAMSEHVTVDNIDWASVYRNPYAYWVVDDD